MYAPLFIDAIEFLNARYRRAIEAHGHFPNELVAVKCLPRHPIPGPHPALAGHDGSWAEPALNVFAITSPTDCQPPKPIYEKPL